MNGESRAKQIFLNTVSGLGGFTGNALLGLALTPYLIYRLGFEPYGFWIVLSTAVNYIGLMDLGVETTFIKYLAQYSASGEWRRVRDVVTFGTLFYTGLAVIFAPIAYLTAPIVVHLMKMSPSLAAQGPRLFFWITLAFFLQSAGGVIGSLLAGIGMLRLVALGNFAGRLAFAAVAVVLAARGAGIPALVIATFVQLGVSTLIFAAMAYARTGAFFSNPLRFERDVLGKLFKLGGWIQVTNLASTVTLETSRLIIAVFVQTASVTTYEIANKLTRTMRSVPFHFVVALLPAVSAMHATGDRASFNRVYVRASRYLNAATAMLVGFVMAAADPICRLWLGQRYPEVDLAVIILGASFICVNLTAIGTCMLRAIAQARYEAYYFLCFAGASIAAMLLLVPAYKLNGVLAGTLAGAVVSTAYFLWLFHRLRGLSLSSGFLAWAWKIGAAFAASTTPIYFAATYARIPLFSSRAGAALEVLALGAAYTLLFAAALFVTRFFEPADRSGIAKIMPGRARALGRRLFPAHLLQGHS